MWQMDSHLVISPIVLAVCQFIHSCSSLGLSFIKEPSDSNTEYCFFSVVQKYISDEREPFIQVSTIL